VPLLLHLPLLCAPLPYSATRERTSTPLWPILSYLTGSWVVFVICTASRFYWSIIGNSTIKMGLAAMVRSYQALAVGPSITHAPPSSD
jgi:hypothetical protein